MEKPIKREPAFDEGEVIPSPTHRVASVYNCGYNRACDEWEEFHKSEMKRIMDGIVRYLNLK